jgi:hypothetical protein
MDRNSRAGNYTNCNNDIEIIWHIRFRGQEFTNKNVITCDNCFAAFYCIQPHSSELYEKVIRKTFLCVNKKCPWTVILKNNFIYTASHFHICMACLQKQNMTKHFFLFLVHVPDTMIDQPRPKKKMVFFINDTFWIT